MNERRRAEIGSRLHAAAVRLLRSVRRDDADAGLSPARLSAVSVLVFRGPCSLGELAAAEQVTAPTMSRLVTWLEVAGYVKRVGGGADARVVTVHPTQKAVRALEAGRRRRVDHVLALLDGLEDPEWARLDQAVELLERSLAEGRAERR